MFNTDIKSVVELMDTFPDEASCIKYLEQIRWAGTPVSPYDPDSKVYKLNDGNYKCKNTQKKFNVRTCSMFGDTKMELRKWFLALWLVTGHKKGISSIQLGKDLGMTQKSAWFMLQRIRKCYFVENYNVLEGIIEADETFYGGKNKNRHNNKKFKQCSDRNFPDKIPIIGMIQRGGKMTAVVLKNTQRESIHPVIKEFVIEGSILHLDDWKAYRGLNEWYDHKTVKDASKGYINDYDPSVHTNNIEGAWKGFKNSARDMYNSVSKKHIQLYVDEFVFRYNLRKHSDSDKFNWLLLNSTTRTKYKDLIYEETQSKGCDCT